MDSNVNTSKASKSLYRELKDDEIRVLTLASASEFSAPLHLSLSTVKLSDKPKYKALSYVWGSPTETSTLYVDEVEFQATINLVSALRHIRDAASEPVLIWVDALCINQSDNEERGSQVQLMTDIYRKTEEVICWLGPAADNSDEAMKLVKRWGEAMEKVGVKQIADVNSNWIEWLGKDDNAQTFIESIEDPFAKQGWETLIPMWGRETIMTRDYWFRLWTFQELALPERVSVKCGSLEVPATYLGCLLILGHRWDEISVHLRNWDPEELAMVGKDRGAVSVLVDRESFHDNEEVQVAYDETTKQSKPSLFDILFRIGRHFCTDRRDVIYSMAGFWREQQPRIEVDYSPDVTWEDALLRFNRNCILHGRLQTLVYAARIGYYEDPTQLSNLPSWCADWARDGDDEEIFENPFPYNCFSAGLFPGNTACPPSFDADQKHLIIRGILCDTVEELPPGSWWHPNDSICKGLIESFLQKSQHSTYIGGMPLLQAFFRTLMTDEDISDDYSASRRLQLQGLCGEDALVSGKLASGAYVVNFLKQYCSGSEPSWYLHKRSDLSEIQETRDTFELASTMFFSKGEGPTRELWDQWNNIAQKYAADFRNHIWNEDSIRSFFTTSKGYMGKSAPYAEKGDIVCLFENCRVPFLVRKDGNGFILIGEAYVPGLMDGEDVVKQGYDASKFETIVIH